MKFVEGGYIPQGHLHGRINKMPFMGCIYACITKGQAKIFGFNIGDSMTDIKTRPLVVKRLGSKLVLYDEQTGEPLQGQMSVVLECNAGGPPKFTVTFEAWGPYGVRFEDEPRQEQ